MNTPDKVFKVSGSKILSLLLTEEALRFSSRQFASIEAFNQAWPGALTLATKIEIKYTAIKSIAKEVPGKNVVIKYKGMAGLPSECVFAFDNNLDWQTFSGFIEKEQYFRRVDEKCPH